MNWFVKIAEDAVKRALKDFFVEKIQIQERIEKLEFDCISVKNHLDACILSLKRDIGLIQEKLEIECRKSNSKIDEKERLIRDDMESGFLGLTKQIDKRLEKLGDKKGIIVDLLKRIAQLEGLIEDNTDVST